MTCLICGAAHAACMGKTNPPRFITDMEIPNMAGPYIADRRLYLDKNGNVVEEGDPNKATLLVHQGGILSRDVAERYGLLNDGGKAKAGPAENKQRKQAPANKAKAE